MCVCAVDLKSDIEGTCTSSRSRPCFGIFAINARANTLRPGRPLTVVISAAFKVLGLSGRALCHLTQPHDCADERCDEPAGAEREAIAQPLRVGTC